MYSRFRKVYVSWVNFPKPCHSPHVSLLVAFELTCKGVIGMKCVFSQGCLLQFCKEHYKFLVALNLDNCGYGKPRRQISCG